VRADLPSGTVTFLFTDVEGSTRLLHDLGADAYAEALAEHRRAIREACAAHGGVEVDTQGDAFFFAFPTAPGAVLAARAMTEELESGPIRVRAGLHTGTPLLAEEVTSARTSTAPPESQPPVTAARCSSLPPPLASWSWSPREAVALALGDAT
jgi:class 3 adenylate cyclase